MILALGSVAGAMTGSAKDSTWYQIDPQLCTRCGLCATECVLQTSAVKCVHTYAMCGYCELCTGFFIPGAPELNEGAENQLCPTAAIDREFIEEPYFAYNIIEDKCIGCAKCVDGCDRFGNGSLYLQIKHELCQHCNECAIALACPANAIRRVSSKYPYLLKETH